MQARRIITLFITCVRPMKRIFYSAERPFGIGSAKKLD